MEFIANVAELFSAQMAQIGDAPGTGSGMSPEEAVIVGMVMLFYLVFGLGFYALHAFFAMRLFRKANVAGWKAWMPIYNGIKFMQLGGYPGVWILINLIPIAGQLVYCVLGCIAAYNIGLKTGKEGPWVLLFIFCPIVWFGILGLDSSPWSERLGKPSVAPEVSPA